MVVDFDVLMKVIGAVMALFSLYGVVEWRTSQKREVVFRKLDLLRVDFQKTISLQKKETGDLYVRKDVNDVIVKQQDKKITDLKDEIDKINTKTEMIPQIQSDVKTILNKMGIESRRDGN